MSAAKMYFCLSLPSPIGLIIHPPGAHVGSTASVSTALGVGAELARGSRRHGMPTVLILTPEGWEEGAFQQEAQARGRALSSHLVPVPLSSGFNRKLRLKAEQLLEVTKLGNAEPGF